MPPTQAHLLPDAELWLHTHRQHPRLQLRQRVAVAPLQLLPGGPRLAAGRHILAVVAADRARRRRGRGVGKLRRAGAAAVDRHAGERLRRVPARQVDGQMLLQVRPQRASRGREGGWSSRRRQFVQRGATAAGARPLLAWARAARPPCLCSLLYWRGFQRHLQSSRRAEPLSRSCL